MDFDRRKNVTGLVRFDCGLCVEIEEVSVVVRAFRFCVYKKAPRQCWQGARGSHLCGEKIQWLNCMFIL